MPASIAVSGTRSTAHRPDSDYTTLFVEYLKPFTAGPGVRVYLGGAIGIDTLALRWLVMATEARVTVVVPSTVKDQPEPARHEIRAAQRGRMSDVVELRHPVFPSVEAYHARNRWMVDRSRLLAAFPLAGGGSSGTQQTIDYAASEGVPRLIVPV